MATPLFPTDQTHQANLVELAEPVEGGILSKPLIDTGGLKQILFSMDTGQSISEHRVPFVATVHVLSGSLSFRVGGRPYQLEANDWLVMPAGEPHDLEAREPVRFLLSMVKS